jgi:hypothetical protein
MDVFKYSTISNENFVKYKVLDLVKLYNFDIKFVFIRIHIKKLNFFATTPFPGAVDVITRT